MALATHDVERSLFLHLETRIKLLEIQALLHRPGERFPERTERWVTVRIAEVERPFTSREGEEHEVYVVQSTCYQKTLQKAGLFGSLSELTDEVRLIVDSTVRAPAAPVFNRRNQQIALLDFGPADETREYGTDVTVEGVAVPGVDVATLTTRCQVSACLGQRS